MKMFVNFVLIYKKVKTLIYFPNARTINNNKKKFTT